MASAGAVVVGGELNGLGVVRSLALGGIPVTVVETAGDRAALWSRHARSVIVRSFAGRAFVEDMLALGKTFDRRPVLLLTDEFAVHAVSEHRGELARHFRFRLPPDATVKLLSDKTLFHAFAQERGFAVPRTAVLATTDDLPRLADLRYPCVIKPNDKRRVLSGLDERAVRVADPRAAAREAAAMLRHPGAIVAQEWIAGPESNIHFTLFYRGRGGRVVAQFTGRKLLCHPRDIGSTAACVAAPAAAAELEAITEAFAAKAGFEGLGSMEYKWDDMHSRFVMIEPTVGRTDWQEEIATLCGVNIPLAAFRHETGLPPLPPPRPQPSIAWRSSFAQRPPAGLLPPGSAVCDGYWRWSDPLPAWSYYVMGGAPRRLFGRWLGPHAARRVARQ